MEGKGSFVILVSVIAFLAVTLAMLVGYIIFKEGGDSEEHEEPPVPHGEIINAEDLATYPLVDTEQIFNLKSEDGLKISVISLKIDLEYFVEVGGVEDPMSKLVRYKPTMLEYVSTYFRGKSLGDISKETAIEEAKNELVRQLNSIINSKVGRDVDMIHSIVFPKWMFQ